MSIKNSLRLAAPPTTEEELAALRVDRGARLGGLATLTRASSGVQMSLATGKT